MCEGENETTSKQQSKYAKKKEVLLKMPSCDPDHRYQEHVWGIWKNGIDLKINREYCFVEHTIYCTSTLNLWSKDVFKSN